MSIDVFVSYHKETGLETARAVVRKLEANGLRCWYQERDSGGYYASVITRMIADCGVFVVVLSQDATKSKYVKSELNLAYERDGLTILPLRISADKLSDSATFYLSGLHWVDAVNRSLDAALDDLCSRALKALGRTTPIYSPWVQSKMETVQYKDGSVYEGSLVDGKRHGRGRLTWPSGDIYEGSFVEGGIHGDGMYTWHNGDVFVGEWKNGTRTGKGKLTKKNGESYEGDFVNEQFHGKGRYVFTGGCVYEGDYVNGKRTGKGKYIWPNGEMYEGDVVDGYRRGKGKLTFPDGGVFEGVFTDGYFTGTGTYTYADGRVETGRLVEGKFLG